MGSKLDQVLSVLNGLVGDYLARTDNGLATEMACYQRGRALPLTQASLSAAHPQASGRALVLVHGLMCDEQVFCFPAGGDYGSRLRDELSITPFYVRYNSGAPIADNGRALAMLLGELVAAYPVPLEELILVGYSMGGLVVRSACHVAATENLPFLSLVQRALYVGTPHLGAPAERAGRVVAALLHAIPDPYTRLIGDVSDLRSAGIKDLGDAALRSGDRKGAWSLRDPGHPVPLLPSIEHGLIAGSLRMAAPVAALFGDGIVPIASATAETMIPPEALSFRRDRVRVMPGRNHLDLAHDEEVYDVLREWCAV